MNETIQNETKAESGITTAPKAETVIMPEPLRDVDEDGNPTGSSLIQYRDMLVRALNLFVGFIAQKVANGSGFTDAESAGFRNLMRLCAREGGKSVKGYYSVLPAAGKLPKVIVEDEVRNPVTFAQVERARDAAFRVTARLLEVLSTKVEQKALYSVKGKVSTIMVPVGQIGNDLPDEASINESWENACARAATPGGIFVEDF